MQGDMRLETELALRADIGLALSLSPRQCGPETSGQRSMIRSAFGMVTGLRGTDWRVAGHGPVPAEADAVIPGRRGERPGGKQRCYRWREVAVTEHGAGRRGRDSMFRVWNLGAW